MPAKTPPKKKPTATHKVVNLRTETHARLDRVAKKTGLSKIAITEISLANSLPGLLNGTLVITNGKLCRAPENQPDEPVLQS